MARLQARRPEVEEAILTRVSAVSQHSGDLEPDYVDGLRATVSAALDYGLAAIERGEERAPPVPVPLLSQARVAARHGINIDTVLRRYLAGHALLNDFLVGEAEGDDQLKGAVLTQLLRAQAVLLDRLLAAVSEEHARESKSRLGTPDARRMERVQRLLDGELVETTGISYDFDACHLGAIAAGPGAAKAIRKLASGLDRQVLIVRPSEEIVWAWFSTAHPFDPDQLILQISPNWPAPLTLAIGEPAQKLAGWRLTHKQAKAALTVGRRRSVPIIRYVDVALLASTLQDNLLTTSLQKLYLSPLEHFDDGGDVARKTLLAYFAAGRNISSAAAALGISRPTVAKRLCAIENTLNRPIRTDISKIELASAIHELASLS